MRFLDRSNEDDEEATAIQHRAAQNSCDYGGNSTALQQPAHRGGLHTLKRAA